MDVGFGTPAVPMGIRYVVTLDSGHPFAARRGASPDRQDGASAEPAPLGPDGRRVIDGYAVLQPRVTPSLPIGRESSLFQRIFSSVSGIDPYASAVSDVYQDLFGEGSYAGKGIYEVDAFEELPSRKSRRRTPPFSQPRSVRGRAGCARAGLVSDIEVVEEFPARYDVGAIRHHRWARGDWQLLPWIFGRAPAQLGAATGAAGLPAIGRWKMLDNLRRTLSAPAAVLALLVGWTLPIHAELIWTLFIVLTIALPTFIPVAAAIPPRRSGVTVSSHLNALGRDLGLAWSLSALTVVFLADQAWLMADAIGRTLWRLGVSRRHSLESIPAAQTMIGPRLLI